jgi:peptidoglycan/xylan/chitin deacetylase (PgdA/CDA1 family)
MRVCCITNDLEATSIYGEPYRKDIAENVLNEALPAVLALYRKYNVKATFYCLASYVEDYPELVGLIEADGHEIASHGLIHNSDQAFDLLTYDEQVEHLRKSKEILEKNSSQKVVSFRAPALRVNEETPKALVETGFLSDSSVAPQRLDIFMSLGSKHKKKWFKAPRTIYKTQQDNLARRGNGIITEIPVSSFGIPYISTVMRLSTILTSFTRRLIYWETKGNNNKVVNFLFHPSEAITIENSTKGEIQKRSKNWLSHFFSDVFRMHLKKKNLGTNSLILLEKELQFWQRKGYEFKTIKECIV